MSSKSLVRAIKVLLFIVVIGTPLFYFRWGIYPYILAKQVFFQSVVEAIFFLWLALAVIDKRYRPRATPFLLGLGVFLFLLTLTAFTGVDSWRSFWSIYERTIGVVAIYHFAGLAVVLSSLAGEIQWKKLFYASLGAAGAVAVIGWMQPYIPNFLLLAEIIYNRPGSTFGNPSFLAGYLLFNVFIGLYLIFDKYRQMVDKSSGKADKNRNKITRFYLLFIYLISTLSLIILGVFFTQTRSDILGLVVGVFALVVLFALQPPDLGVNILRSRYFYTGILVLVAVFAATFWFTRGYSFWSKVPAFGRFRSVSFSLNSSEFQPRLIAVQAAWKGFLERPFFGWGPENFNIVFNKYYDPRTLEAAYQETRFDKPHNVPMEYLISGGALLALAYFGLFGLFFFEVRRMKDKPLSRVIVAATVAYLVRSLFAFDTTGPLLMLYLFFGFVDGEYRENFDKDGEIGEKNSLDELDKNRNKADKWKKAGTLFRYVPYFFFVAALLAAYFLNFLTLRASYYQFMGFQYFLHGRPNQGIYSFKSAAATWSPYRWNFQRDSAIEVAQAYFYSPGVISGDDALAAVRAAEEVRDQHQLDAYNHYALVNIYNEVSALNPKKFLAAAERGALRALELSPNRQEVYFYLAKTKSLEGDNQSSLQILKKALDLDPKVPDAHFYYGLLAFATGNPALGYDEIKQAMKLGRRWVNFYEPRAVAGYFADAGHLSEAVKLYETAFSMQPDDLETQIKLGVAYFFNKQINEATWHLTAAGKRFDFRTSPAYSQLRPILEELRIRY